VASGGGSFGIRHIRVAIGSHTAMYKTGGPYGSPGNGCRPDRRCFVACSPRRRLVERTFPWLCQNRRVSRDYKRLCATSEALIYAAMGRLMLRRLARTQFSDSF
jgi:hypothetical protein